MNFPPVSMYSAMRTDGREFRRPDHSIDTSRIVKQAKHDTVILDLASMVENPDIVAALRRENPNIKLIAYVVMKVSYWWSGAFFTEMYRAVKSLEGFLYATDGSPWRDSNINTARLDVVDAIAPVIARYLSGTDGLFLDVFCAGMLNATASGVDWGRAGFTTEAEFQQAWAFGHVALVNRLKALTPIVGNCGPASHADVNGWMRENFPFQNGGTWYTNMIKLTQPNGAEVPGVLKETYREPFSSWIVPTDGSNEKDRQRKGRWALGSACLRDGVHASFERREWDDAWCAGGRYIILPEYSVEPGGTQDFSISHKGWLGSALAPATQLTAGLWMRDFQHGVVLVNPSNTHISYYGDELLRTISGPWKKAWSVPFYDSLFLVRT